MAEKEDKQRLEELRGEQNRLQAQCYLLKTALETNEQQLARIAAVIAEHEAEDTPPSTDTARRVPTEGEE